MLRLIISLLIVLPLVAFAKPQKQEVSNDEKNSHYAVKESSSSKPSNKPGAEYYVEKAYQFIENRKDIFKLENPRDELILKRASIRPDRQNNAVIFTHAVNGVKVLGAGYTIRLKADGKVFDFSGMIHPEAKKVDTTPRISKQQVIDIVIKEAGEGDPDADDPPVKDPELLIAKFDDEFILIWFTGMGYSAKYGTSGNYFYYIDAQNGEVLTKRKAWSK